MLNITVISKSHPRSCRYGKIYVVIIWCFILCVILIETVINLQDEEGFTPLMWAAAHGQIAVVEFLLQNVRKNILFRSHGFSILEHSPIYLCTGGHFILYHSLP